jgi:nucleoside-diphosphate-sugar epimerase
VTVLDDLSNSVANPAVTLALAKLVEGTILNQELLDHCVQGKQYIFHLAALGSVPRSVEHPRLYHKVNTTGTINVLQAARNFGVKRVMYAASSSAYGDSPTLPKTESMPPRPLSPYAATKLAGEHYMAAFSACYGVETACLRYFNIFGPRQSAASAYAAVIAAFATALLAGKRPVIFGDGTQSRDFTYVDNAVHANLLAARAEKGTLHGQPINIATGRQMTVGELATLMAQQLGKADLKADHQPPRTGDVLHSLADLSLARQLLGYTPIVALPEGMAATLKWYAAAR